MSDANPLGGATPYEVLGVSPESSRDRIKYHKKQLIQEYRERMVDAQERNDTDGYSEAVDALKAIDDAWEWVQANHDPPVPLVDPQPLDGETPHETLGIGEAASLSEAAERRDELLAEYTTELSTELYERDPWRFRQVVATIERVDDAWVTLSSREDTPGD